MREEELRVRELGRSTLAKKSRSLKKKHLK